MAAQLKVIGSGLDSPTMDRQKALEAAKGGDPNEEITRRAVELLKYFGRRIDPNRTQPR